MITALLRCHFVVGPNPGYRQFEGDDELLPIETFDEIERFE
jgi:hypothetical protein